MTKRKDLGKRQGGLKQRFWNWVAGNEPPTMQDALINHGSTISSMPDSHNSNPLDGDIQVGFTTCRTVGEYKAACRKFYNGIGDY